MLRYIHKSQHKIGGIKMNEQAYLKKSKMFSLLSRIIGLLCVVTIIISYFCVVEGPFYDISFVRILANQQDIDVLETEGSKAASMILSAPSEEKAELEAILGISIEEISDDLRAPSLNDAIKYSEITYDKAPYFNEFKEANDMFKTIRMIIAIYASFIGLFSLLAALLKCRPLTYIALFISMMYFILLAGFVFMFIFIALSVTHIVMVTKAKSNKKAASIAATVVPQQPYTPYPPTYPNMNI